MSKSAALQDAKTSTRHTLARFSVSVGPQLGYAIDRELADLAEAIQAEQAPAIERLRTELAEAKASDAKARKLLADLVRAKRAWDRKCISPNHQPGTVADFERALSLAWRAVFAAKIGK